MRSIPRRTLTCLPIALLIFSLAACRAGGPSVTPSAETTRSHSEATPEAKITAVSPSPTPGVTATREPTSEATAEGVTEPAPGSCEDIHSDLFRTGLVESAEGALDDLRGLTVYQISLQIENDLSAVAGQQVVCYTNREGEPLQEIVFRLFPNILGGGIEVRHVRVDGRDVLPTYGLADSALEVPLEGELKPGETAVIEIDFDVQVPTEIGGNYGLFGLSEGILTLHEVYPVIPVYDDEGWNVELPARSGDITYYDAAFYRVKVTAPADLVVVASGVEVGREERPGETTITFAAGPARGFYVAASREYVVVTGRTGDTTVNSYALPGQEEAAGLALEFATHALESFNHQFGAYPYTELDVVSTPMTALGMEYPGIIVITLKVYSLDDQVRGTAAPIMMEGTVGHEVAHQWFYNLVGNDQIDEPWLDEAVVQYVTGLYYRDQYGEQGYQGWRGSWLDRWDRVDQAEIPIGLPVAEYESGAYGAVVYGRGPLFIEALASEMGQEKFEAFLRDYVETYAWDIGTGEAFLALAQQHCQCDLTPLFREWVYP